MEIKSYKFSKEGREQVFNEAKGTDWPVVYLINNKNCLYIGETSNFYNRFGQHLDNKQKNGLTDVHVIFDDEFNKSAVLDIEQSLIRMCSADGKFELLNGNAGQSPKHNYYQREKYLNKIEGSKNDKGIWVSLRELNLANNTYDTIVNSNLFTYSPYISLTSEQEFVCYNVINDLLKGLKGNSKDGTTSTSIINGAAGTGKTVLAIYIMSLLASANAQKIDPYEDKESYGDEETCKDESFKNKILHELNEYVKHNGKLKIGYVLPMSSLRATILKVFKNQKSKIGLDDSMVIGPADVVKKEYDILLVDESHRLYKRKNITNYKSFDDCCKKLNNDNNTSNVLDWIVKCSKNRILFYDKDQSIKASDISPEEFKNSISKTSIKEYKLTSQIRCEGGKLYIDYLAKIFECSVTKKEEIKKYDVKVFDNPNHMINNIKKLNDKYGLCRNVAGYAWKWKTKNKHSKNNESKRLYDIKFGNKTYKWNVAKREWILRKESINEIGCIHTTQGYDLNYVGVILGWEIDYDPVKNQILIDRDKFYDTNVKKGTTDEELKRYIINSYKVMMERGIKGCYVYACNKNMNEYLKKYLN
jgi:hypothetical protein